MSNQLSRRRSTGKENKKQKLIKQLLTMPSNKIHSNKYRHTHTVCRVCVLRVCIQPTSRCIQTLCWGEPETWSIIAFWELGSTGLQHGYIERERWKHRMIHSNEVFLSILFLFFIFIFLKIYQSLSALCCSSGGLLAIFFSLSFWCVYIEIIFPYHIDADIPCSPFSSFFPGLAVVISYNPRAAIFPYSSAFCLASK